MLEAIGLLKGKGKMAPNLEDLVQVRKKNLRKGAYKLKTLDGRLIPRTLNVDNLKIFFK